MKSTALLPEAGFDALRDAGKSVFVTALGSRVSPTMMVR